MSTTETTCANLAVIANLRETMERLIAERDELKLKAEEWQGRCKRLADFINNRLEQKGGA